MTEPPDRLSMPLGEAIFTQRSIRRFKPDPISTEDLTTILNAAFKAPNGGNAQIARFLAVRDRALIEQFGVLYKKAWWAKRFDGEGWRGPEDIPPDRLQQYGPPMRLADEMGSVPCVVFALALPPGQQDSVLPATQNLMLAARALGIGSVPTRLHPVVMDDWRALFHVPPEVTLHFSIPLGYPRGKFGPTTRRPIEETAYWNVWGGLLNEPA